jgi:hypothetical protein
MPQQTIQERRLEIARRPTLLTIYALKDPFTNQVRYIGATQNLRARMNCHRYDRYDDRLDTAKARWMRSLGRFPTVEVLETVPYPDTAHREKYWIERFVDDGADLTNIVYTPTIPPGGAPDKNNPRQIAFEFEPLLNANSSKL